MANEDQKESLIHPNERERLTFMLYELEERIATRMLAALEELSIGIATGQVIAVLDANFYERARKEHPDAAITDGDIKHIAIQGENLHGFSQLLAKKFKALRNWSLLDSAETQAREANEHAYKLLNENRELRLQIERLQTREANYTLRATDIFIEALLERLLDLKSYLQTTKDPAARRLMQLEAVCEYLLAFLVHHALLHQRPINPPVYEEAKAKSKRAWVEWPLPYRQKEETSP